MSVPSFVPLDKMYPKFHEKQDHMRGILGDMKDKGYVPTVANAHARFEEEEIALDHTPEGIERLRGIENNGGRASQHYWHDQVYVNGMAQPFISEDTLDAHNELVKIVSRTAFHRSWEVVFGRSQLPYLSFDLQEEIWAAGFDEAIPSRVAADVEPSRLVEYAQEALSSASGQTMVFWQAKSRFGTP